MQLRFHCKSYKCNAQTILIQSNDFKEKSRNKVGCIETCLTQEKGILVSSQLGVCGPPYSLVLAPRDLAYA
jgi:hypothetical protein